MTSAQQRSIDLCVGVHLRLSVSWLDFPESTVFSRLPISALCLFVFLFFLYQVSGGCRIYWSLKKKSSLGFRTSKSNNCSFYVTGSETLTRNSCIYVEPFSTFHLEVMLFKLGTHKKPFNITCVKCVQTDEITLHIRIVVIFFWLQKLLLCRDSAVFTLY